MQIDTSIPWKFRPSFFQLPRLHFVDSTVDPFAKKSNMFNLVGIVIDRVPIGWTAADGVRQPVY